MNAEQPIRILYTITWMDVGGSQTHLLQVFRLLDRSRFAPKLYCLTGRGNLIEAVEASGVPVEVGGIANGFKSPRALREVVNLARFMRRERIDIVHNYLLRANVAGSIAARLARVPVVLCSKRGCHERRGSELLGAKLSNWLADCVTTNANAVRDFVHENEGCPKEKMEVIPSGVDTDRFRPGDAAEAKKRLGLDPGRPVIGCVTRMRVRKGIEELLRAMISVRERHPEAQTVIVGEVELDPDLQQLVAAGGLQPHLWLLGRRDDMPAVYPAFDVFVLPSHDEGMSNAILEAMAAERPVVATDVGGTGEVVRHGENGLLVPPRDPAPLASAIGGLLDAPDRWAAMGKRGREIVEAQFSARAMVRRMEELYATMLHRRKRASTREPIIQPVL
jgi:glycosyltransferase involved in cell wall biosynthesis